MQSALQQKPSTALKFLSAWIIRFSSVTVVSSPVTWGVQYAGKVVTFTPQNYRMFKLAEKVLSGDDLTLCYADMVTSFLA